VLPWRHCRRKVPRTAANSFTSGRRRTVTVGQVSENAALAFAEQVEELLDLMAR
jgi:hypothetical protein